MNNKPTIYFVCRGNTCRSPMAAGLAQEFIQQHNLPFKVGSFGVSVGEYGGHPACSNAKEVCEEIGISISGHRTTGMHILLGHQDPVLRVFCMEQYHVDRISQEFGQLMTADCFSVTSDKVVTLVDGADVDDPIGSRMKNYRELRDFLRPRIQQRLIELARECGCPIVASPKAFSAGGWEDKWEGNYWQGEDEVEEVADSDDELWGPLESENVADSELVLIELDSLAGDAKLLALSTYPKSEHSTPVSPH